MNSLKIQKFCKEHHAELPEMRHHEYLKKFILNKDSFETDVITFCWEVHWPASF